MAGDVERAKSFYGELFGWKFKRGEQDPSYEHIYAGEEGIGGILKNDPKWGAPPHWLGYVSVDNVDQSVSLVTKAGGKVYHREDIPTVGQFAVCGDPQGAVFSPFHYTGKDAGKPESNAMPGTWTFCWDELLTSDPDAAAKFYNAVFGWGAEHMEMPGGRYTLLKRKGVKDERGQDKNAAGLMKRPPGVPANFWLAYVAVPDADAVVAKAKKLGANVPMPIMEVPDVGRFTTILDRDMAAIAILQPQPRR
jgi:predicted enzyme related to lactoylglutathione lyase